MQNNLRIRLTELTPPTTRKCFPRVSSYVNECKKIACCDANNGERNLISRCIITNYNMLFAICRQLASETRIKQVIMPRDGV